MRIELTFDDVPRALLETGERFRAFQEFVVPRAVASTPTGRVVPSRAAFLLPFLAGLRDLLQKFVQDVVPVVVVRGFAGALAFPTCVRLRLDQGNRRFRQLQRHDC